MPGRRPTRYSLPYGEGTITKTEFRRASKEKQKEIMRHWFRQNYTDPVENTPYESAEGGYVYIWGGPYEPKEELEGKFGGAGNETAIEELADELRDITWEWTGNPDDQVDDYLIDSISRSVPLVAFHNSLSNIEELLDLDVGARLKENFFRLLYANVITALETYLSDFFVSKVLNDSKLLRQFVEKNKAFQKEQFPISQVFRVRDEIEARAKTYLNGVVWHRFDKVKSLYEDVLQVDFPADLGKLFKAVLVRHDIIHRNGKTLDGVEHTITKEQISELMSAAGDLVNHVEDWKPQVIADFGLTFGLGEPPAAPPHREAIAETSD